MKAREVSVGIQDMDGEYIVVARFKVPGKPLEREPARPDNSQIYEPKYGLRVKESARKRKEKELRKILEAIDFG